MRFYTFGLAFFLSLPFAFAQSDTVESKNYILSKIIETINIQSKGYYLLKINDLRTSKNNLGTIKIKKVKQIVSTDDSLPQYLFNAFYPNSQIDSITKPLIINIEKLKTFGSSNGTIDQAELYIKLYVQTFQNNNLVTVHTFERTFNYQKKARPEFLKKFIFNSLATSISNLPLEIQNSKTNSQKVSDPKIQSAIENTHTIPISNSFKFSHLKYKINEIIDERTDTSNVGNVYVGYFNRNAKARLDSGLKTFGASGVFQDVIHAMGSTS